MLGKIGIGEMQTLTRENEFLGIIEERYLTSYGCIQMRLVLDSIDLI